MTSNEQQFRFIVIFLFKMEISKDLADFIRHTADWLNTGKF